MSSGSTGYYRIDLVNMTVQPGDEATCARLDRREIQVDGATYRASLGSSRPSPDRQMTVFLAHRVGWRGGPRRLTNRLWIEAAAGGEPILIPADGHCREPLWMPDGKQLWFLHEPLNDSGPTEVHCYDLDRRVVTPVPDPGCKLQPTPQLLADGHWLVLQHRVTSTAQHPTVDLVVSPTLRPGAARQVVYADGVSVRYMAASPNGLVIWLATNQSVQRFDRVANRITHTWLLSELLPAAEPLLLGQMQMRPDGDAVAVTCWSDEVGVDVLRPELAVIEMGGSVVPPRIHRLATGGGMLLGFVPRVAAAPK